MGTPPKAPPVYKPVPPRLAAPPVYRSNQVNAPSAQLKATNGFNLKTRPAPPVYRPPQMEKSRVQPKPGGSVTTAGCPAFPTTSLQARALIAPGAAAQAAGLPSNSVQMSRKRKLEEDPYKKVYKPVSFRKPPRRESARKHKVIKFKKPPKRYIWKAKQKEAIVYAPSYTIQTDKLGNKIWSGDRDDCKWSTSVKSAMASSKSGGCQIKKKYICQGSADGIDHVKDFASVQGSLPRYVICDGKHHWSACYYDDANDLFNNNEDTSGLQWACTQCNSSKNGKKGLKENQPKWISACPGGSDCTYSHKGEDAES
jgi:hypothetical protein